MVNVMDFFKSCGNFIVCTMNRDCPAARPFGAIMEYKNDLYISTSPSKEVYNQLKSNRNVQLIAIQKDTRNWLRIIGAAKECNKPEIKLKMLKECPQLLRHFSSENDNNFALFQINPSSIEFKQGDKIVSERKFFNKLVRDKIPELLDKNGGETETEILSGEEYIKCLREKLGEECNEVVNADSRENLVEELADLKEVVLSLIKANNITDEEIENTRIQKRSKRGGFDSRIFLKSSNIVKKI